MTSRPITAVATWQAVILAARGRCQCTGACGNRHTKTDQRCPVVHDQHVKGKCRIRLAAAPDDPSMPFQRAATLPASQLKAWCPGCYRAAVRRLRTMRAERASQANDTDRLF